jgi:hypothetical protein
MKQSVLITWALVLISIASGMAQAADDDTYKVHVYSWSYGRERKTITSSNRVTANFMIKNVTQANLADVSLTLTYSSGTGEKVANPIVKKVGALKAGESQKIAMVGDFIPVFGAYEIVVEYAPSKKEEWYASSDISQPNPKNGEPVSGTASLIVLGKEVTPDRTGRFAGTIRVKNEGTVEAKNLKINVVFFDAKKQKMGEVTEKLGNGGLPGGAEENIPFAIAKAPRNYGGYEMKAICDDTSAEVGLSGGEFSNSQDVEFAKFLFKRADPKSPDLKVSAQVRNGLKEPVEQVKLTLVFMNAKKKELKRHTFDVPGQLKPGETKPLEFTVSGLPSYEAFEQAVAFKKVGSDPGPSKPSVTKIDSAKFQNTKEVEVIFTDSVTNDDKSVTLVGSMRNGKSHPVKDVAITAEFLKADGGHQATGEKVLTDVVQPGEERNFTLKAAGASGFGSYSFKLKFVELNDKPASASAKINTEDTQN